MRRERLREAAGTSAAGGGMPACIRPVGCPKLQCVSPKNTALRRLIAAAERSSGCSEGGRQQQAAAAAARVPLTAVWIWQTVAAHVGRLVSAVLGPPGRRVSGAANQSCRGCAWWPPDCLRTMWVACTVCGSVHRKAKLPAPSAWASCAGCERSILLAVGLARRNNISNRLAASIRHGVRYPQGLVAARSGPRLWHLAPSVQPEWMPNLRSGCTAAACSSTAGQSPPPSRPMCAEEGRQG